MRGGVERKGDKAREKVGRCGRHNQRKGRNGEGGRCRGGGRVHGGLLQDGDDLGSGVCLLLAAARCVIHRRAGNVKMPRTLLCCGAPCTQRGG